MKSFLKRALFLLLAPTLLLAALYGWVVIRSPAPDSGRLVRTADRRLVWSGDTVQVRLHVNADKELPARSDDAARKPHVIALVIDHSGSMGQGSQSPLEAVKSAAAIFARVTTSAEQPVGAISFDQAPTQVAPLGADGNACAEAILQVPSGGGTDISGAVLAGRDMVADGLRSGRYPRASGLIVLLSDGQSDRSAALQAAEQVKGDPAFPVRIITIGLGAQIDEDLLRQMASSEADFHFTLDPASLGDIYSTIAADFGTAIGYNGQLSEQFNYGGFTLEKPPTEFHVQSDPARGQFDIRFPVLFQQRLTIPYTLRAEKIGLYGLALKPAELTHTPDPNRPEQTRQLVSTLSPPLLVISPLLLLLLYLPLLGYLVWKLLQLLRKPPPAPPEPKPVRAIELPPPLPLRKPEPVRERKPQPTLFLGVGEAGLGVLSHVADYLAADRYLSQVADPPFHLLYADTRAAEPPASDPRFPIYKAQLPTSLGGSVRRLRGETRLPEHLDWIPRRELAEAAGSQLDLSEGAHGNRWLSRLSLFEACQSADNVFWEGWGRAVEWLTQHRGARIVLVGSLEGGTGGALASDLAYLLRQALPPNFRAEWSIYAMGLADLPSAHAYARANQHAFLAELDRLTIATRVPQAAIFNPSPPAGLDYLDGRIDEPVFDRFFLFQSPANLYPEDVDREFLSQVAATCHVFTEHSLADGLEAYLGSVRSDEAQYQSRHLEGTVHSAWQYLLRFPVPQIARRLACRFVREILGTHRLVGVALGPDGRRPEQPPAPAKPVAEAVGYWSRLDEDERAPGPIYHAFCQAAASEEARAAVPAMQRAAQGTVPSPEEFRAGLRRFANTWFSLLLNGSPDDGDEARADWVREKILLLQATLAGLVEFGRAARSSHQRRGVGEADAPSAWLDEIQRHHEEWLAQVRLWLQTLVGSEVVPEAPAADFKGVYRSVSDEEQEIERELEEESRSTWQSILGPEDVQNPSLREDALYAKHFDQFLEDERGFLLRWFWEFTEPSGDAVPELRLRVITDADRRYAPGADGARELLRDLFQLADSRTRDLDHVTILDALRSEAGELRLGPLARRLAGFDSGDRGLRINRQFPGGDQIRRQIFVMVPESRDEEMLKFKAELRRHLAFDLTLVEHGDPHVIRAAVVDSVIPIKAAQLRPPADGALPFIFTPEQEGERVRGEFTAHLGIAPSPQLHPLTRLLAAAPRRRSEWIGILAEDCIRPSTGDGVNPTLVIRDGAEAEPMLSEHQGQSWVWATVNLAYKVRGLGPAEAARLRWQARDRATKVEMLGRAAETWQARADSALEGSAEQTILSQVVLLIRLEHELEQRRAQEDEG